MSVEQLNTKQVLESYIKQECKNILLHFVSVPKTVTLLWKRGDAKVGNMAYTNFFRNTLGILSLQYFILNPTNHYIFISWNFHTVS